MANSAPMAAARAQAMVKEESLGPMGTSGMDPKTSLPTFIYDYFLKKKKYDLAHALLQSDLGVNSRPRTKRSPDNRELNGDNTVDTDPKLDSMPEASISEQLPNESFLQDWWCVFWDVWNAGKNKGGNGAAAQYLSQNTRNQQFKQQQAMAQSQIIGARGMAGFPTAMNRNNNMRMDAAINNRNIAQMRMNGQLQPQGGDMGGQGRPQSPMSSDNAPSPKRPRVDGPPFGTPQMNPGARPGAPMGMSNVPGNPNMMNSMDPMSAQFNGMGKPGQANMQQFGAMNRSFSGNQGMMGGFNSEMDIMDAEGMRNMGNGGNPQGGALADYQMQLMLLEQQNKKRLLMARQEQEVTSSGGGHPPGTTQALMGGGGPFGQGLSPRRNAQSPSPNDPMKRVNSGIGQASPRPDGQMPITRGSPAPGGFDPTGMPPGINPQFFGGGQMGKMGDGMTPNGMRPGGPGFPGPGNAFNQSMDMMRARGGMPPGSFGNQGPPGPQGPGGNMSQMQQNNSQQNPMPPPSAPNLGANSNAGRTNPSSPQQNANPPTPSQTKAANPKGNKKDNAKDKKTKQAKKPSTATAVIPTSESEGNGPPTPTPPTPITPVAHDNPFGSKATNGQRPSNGAPPQPQTNGNPPGMLGQQDMQPFGAMDATHDDLLDFGEGLENEDPLGNFTFDNFLTDPNDTTFNFDASGFNLDPGMEMGSRDV